MPINNFIEVDKATGEKQLIPKKTSSEGKAYAAKPSSHQYSKRNEAFNSQQSSSIQAKAVHKQESQTRNLDRGVAGDAPRLATQHAKSSSGDIMKKNITNINPEITSKKKGFLKNSLTQYVGVLQE